MGSNCSPTGHTRLSGRPSATRAGRTRASSPHAIPSETSQVANIVLSVVVFTAMFIAMFTACTYLADMLERVAGLPRLTCVGG